MLTRPTFTPGWRIFFCEDCRVIFGCATRDHKSPSLESCPECNGDCFPIFCTEDNDLLVDGWKNLVGNHPTRQFTL